MSDKTRHQLEVPTDHFQVLVGDAKRGPEVDTTHLWDAGGALVSLKGAPELVGLATVRAGGITRVEVDVLPGPFTVGDKWLDLGGFILSVPSGRIILWGPEVNDLSQAPSLSLPPGRYEGRAFSRGTEAVKDEMAPNGPDEYRIVLWRTE